MLRGILGWAYAVTIFVTGCGATLVDTSPQDSADSQMSITHDPCTGRQTRCQGSSFQTCESGRFEEQQRCGSVDMCDPTWRCVPYNSCASGPDLIYVIDATGVLHSFNPRAEQAEQTVFQELGRPQCAAAVAAFSSLSVDHQAQAWVTTPTGDIYQINPRTLACNPVAVKPQYAGYLNFALGFANDDNGSSLETLYLAGADPAAMSSGYLGRVDPVQLSVSPVGQLPELHIRPALAGTLGRELFGYYPITGGPTVAKINKDTAKYDQYWDAPGLSAAATAWAMAAWGRKLYIFVSTGTTTQIQIFDPQSGQTEVRPDSLPFAVVGAGAATCTPSPPG